MPFVTPVVHGGFKFEQFGYGASDHAVAVLLDGGQLEVVPRNLLAGADDGDERGRGHAAQTDALDRVLVANHHGPAGFEQEIEFQNVL